MCLLNGASVPFSTIVQTTLTVQSNRKIRFASFTDAITDSINLRVIVDETSASRKTPHEEEKSIFRVKFISCRHGKGTRGKNVYAQLNKWLLNNFLLRNLLVFCYLPLFTRYCLMSYYKWISIKKKSALWKTSKKRINYTT